MLEKLCDHSSKKISFHNFSSSIMYILLNKTGLLFWRVAVNTFTFVCVYDMRIVLFKWSMFEEAWRGSLSRRLLSCSLGFTYAHTNTLLNVPAWVLPLVVVSLFAVFRDYKRLRVFCTGSTRHYGHSPVSWLQMGIECSNLFPIWSQSSLWGKK